MDNEGLPGSGKRPADEVEYQQMGSEEGSPAGRGG